MELTREQYEQIQDYLPVPRGNVGHDNLVLLNAILHVAEHGFQVGVLDQLFAKLQQRQVLRLKIEVFSLDSTSVKVHPDGTGAFKRTDHRPSESRAADGTPKFIWLPRMLERP